VEALRAEIRRAGYRGGFTIRNVSFTLNEGEALLVTGPSGSGKTTLIKTLLGLIDNRRGVFEGRILYYGKPLEAYSPIEKYRLLCYIPQEPWYGIISYTVDSEYCLSLSQAGVKCDPRRLEKYGLWSIRGRVTYGLSAGQYQRLTWASMIDRDCKIIMIDEPLVYIDNYDKEKFTRFIGEALSGNKAVIIVDHEPRGWMRLKPKTLSLKEGIIDYYGSYENYRGVSPLNPRLPAVKAGKPALKAENIWFKYEVGPWILRGVNLTVGENSVIGITGRNGAGKTTLLKVLSGILRPSKGTVWRGFGAMFVPEDPLLFFSHPTPREEIYVGGNPRIADDIVEGFNLKSLLDRPLAYLSTGEKRRVALASALAHNYRILLLDEPSGGLDKYNLSVLVDSLYEAARRGSSIIISTHDQRLIPYLQDKYVLEEGVLRRV
jgi:energy-coupling factor transporter ATP-binding protein EcfA2